MSQRAHKSTIDHDFCSNRHVDVVGMSSIGRWLSTEHSQSSSSHSSNEDDSADTATIETVTAICFVDAIKSPALTPTLMQWPLVSPAYEPITMINECPFTFGKTAFTDSKDVESSTFCLSQKIEDPLRHRRRKSRASLTLQEISATVGKDKTATRNMTPFEATLQMLRAGPR